MLGCGGLNGREDDPLVGIRPHVNYIQISVIYISNCPGVCIVGVSVCGVVQTVTEIVGVSCECIGSNCLDVSLENERYWRVSLK